MACYDLRLPQKDQLLHYEPRRVSLNGKRHYILDDFPNVPQGTVLPSCTTVLSSMAPVSKTMAIINWRKKVGDDEANRRTRLAANRGTWLHAIIEDWFGGEDIENHLDQAPSWRPYFTAAEPFLQTIDQPLLIESAVGWWHEERRIGFSGTLDMVASMTNGTTVLLDWKTSFKEKPDRQLADYKRQLGAYSMAVEQMYDISLEEACCVIACYDPEQEGSEPFLQLVHLDRLELVCQQRIMADTVTRYFQNHYPGARAFTLTADKG